MASPIQSGVGRPGEVAELLMAEIQNIPGDVCGSLHVIDCDIWNLRMIHIPDPDHNRPLRYVLEKELARKRGREGNDPVNSFLAQHLEIVPLHIRLSMRIRNQDAVLIFIGDGLDARQDLGEKEVFGKTCKVYTYKTKSLLRTITNTVWVWQGIILKMETKGALGANNSMMVKEFEENPKLPESTFAIPEKVI